MSKVHMCICIHVLIVQDCISIEILKAIDITVD